MRTGLHALGPGRRPACFELNVVDQKDEGQAGSGSLGVVNYSCLVVLSWSQFPEANGEDESSFIGLFVKILHVNCW